MSPCRTMKLVFATALLLAFSACHSKQSPSSQGAAGSSPGAGNSAAPAAPSAPAPGQAQAPKPASLDGDWSGNSGEDLPISFTVKNNQVSQMNLNYRFQIGSCSTFASFGSDSTAAINGKSFTLTGKRDQMGAHAEYTVNGTFHSDKEASGTIRWVGKSEQCGNFEGPANWTAKKGAAADSDSDAAEKEDQ